MPLRKRKPTSPGRRFQTVSDFSDITKTKPEKSLLAPKHASGGRNAYGRKTARHRGGGHKQLYRIVDFKRNKDGVPATVAAILVDQFRKELPADATARAKALRRSLPEIVTVASLVEREGKADDERPLIASVIYNRLRIGMPRSATSRSTRPTIRIAIPASRPRRSRTPASPASTPRSAPR